MSLSTWSTGKYKSRRNGKIYSYKSSWEVIYMDLLDSSDDILEWDYESVFVMYLDKTKVKKYIPDFLLTLKTGLKIIVEIKPLKMRNSVINTSKRMAILQKCKEEGWKYYEWSPGEPLILV